MSHLKRRACALLAIVATASMQVASADDIIDSQPYVTTHGDTRTKVLPTGTVAYMVAYDTSSVDIFGGHVSHLTMNDDSSVQLMFGDVSHLTLNDTTVATVAGGEVSHVTLNDSTTAIVANGEISWLNVYDNSKATILGAAALSWLVVSETSRVDIYVTDATYSNGHLSGTWLNGAPFQFRVAIGSFGAPSTTPTELPPNITLLSVPSAPAHR